MRKEALIILAEGFEEIEAVTPIDVLRRANVNVIVAGLSSKIVKGSRRICVQADLLLSEYQGNPNVLILPGGVQGANHLHQSDEVTAWILKMQKADQYIAAICAAPAVVLAPTGILNGRHATCYPGYEKEWSKDIRYGSQKAVVDGKLITSQGPGTALDFSLAIVEKLFDHQTAVSLASALIHALASK